MQSFQEITDILRKIWAFQILSFNTMDVRVYHIVGIILIFFLTRLVIRLTRRILNREIHRRNLDEGRILAIYQIAKYVIIVIAMAIGLEMLGFQLTILLAGSAALACAPRQRALRRQVCAGDPRATSAARPRPPTPGTR